jgi:beta-carotene 3-hydroxylase
MYGFAYFLVHDVFIHQRFRFLRNTNNRYFKAIRRAHKVHHKYLTKEDGECFGMLLVPFKFLKSESKQSAASA